MIPAAFEYTRAASVDEALRMLAADDGAKVIAGGQSLLPLLKLRLASRRTLVDIGRLDELRGISQLDDGRLAIGRADDLRRAPGLGRRALRRAAGRAAVDRRRPGPQPRDRRRRRSRTPTRPRTSRPSLLALGRGDRAPVGARRRGRCRPDGFFEGPFQTGDRARRAPDRSHPARAAAGRRRASAYAEARAAGVRLRDGRASRRSSSSERGTSIETRASASPGVGEHAVPRDGGRGRARWARRLGRRHRGGRGARDADAESLSTRTSTRNGTYRAAMAVVYHPARDRGGARARGLSRRRLNVASPASRCGSSGSSRATPPRPTSRAPCSRATCASAASRWSKGRRLSAADLAVLVGRACRCRRRALTVLVLGGRRPPRGRGGAAARRRRSRAPGSRSRGPVRGAGRPPRGGRGRRSTSGSPTSSGWTGSTRSRCSRRSTGRSWRRASSSRRSRWRRTSCPASVIEAGAAIARHGARPAGLGRAVRPDAGRGHREGVAPGGRPGAVRAAASGTRWRRSGRRSPASRYVRRRGGRGRPTRWRDLTRGPGRRRCRPHGRRPITDPDGPVLRRGATRLARADRPARASRRTRARCCGSGGCGATAVLGLPTCGAYSKATAADLLLPRLLTGRAAEPRRRCAGSGTAASSPATCGSGSRRTRGTSRHPTADRRGS